MLDDADDERAERASVKLKAGGFTLRAPEVAVDVEDAEAEEVMEVSEGAGAFGEGGEVGFEEVFDVGRVGGDDATGAETGEGEGVGWGGGEDVGGPVEETVAVVEELGEVSDERVGL